MDDFVKGSGWLPSKSEPFSLGYDSLGHVFLESCVVQRHIVVLLDSGPYQRGLYFFTCCNQGFGICNFLHEPWQSDPRTKDRLSATSDPYHKVHKEAYQWDEGNNFKTIMHENTVLTELHNQKMSSVVERRGMFV